MLNAIQITKSINRKLGLTGVENNKRTWKQVKNLLESATCQCDHQCKCYGVIVDYMINIRRKQR